MNHLSRKYDKWFFYVARFLLGFGVVFQKFTHITLKVWKYLSQSAKAELLTTSDRSEVKKYKLLNNRYIQSAKGGQLTRAESGQDHLLMQFICSFKHKHKHIKHTGL